MAQRRRKQYRQEPTDLLLIGFRRNNQNTLLPGIFHEWDADKITKGEFPEGKYRKAFFDANISVKAQKAIVTRYGSIAEPITNGELFQRLTEFVAFGRDLTLIKDAFLFRQYQKTYICGTSSIARF